MVNTLVLIYFGRSPLGHTIKTNISDCLSTDTLNFKFLYNGLGLPSPPHFVNNSSRQTFLMLYSIK